MSHPFCNCIHVKVSLIQWKRYDMLASENCDDRPEAEAVV